GHARDYDEWAAMGAEGWDWASVLPMFRRSECNVRGASALHGGDGPLAVSDPRHRNPLSAAFVEAAGQAGHAASDDFNGASQEGFGWYQTTTRDGSRCSSATAYLKPARARPNLKVVTRASANRVTFRDGRADGVIYASGGTAFHERAGREVILCGG